MKKFLALLLIVCMIIPVLVSCNGGSDDANDDTTTTSNEEATVVPTDITLVADGKTDYVIVRPEKALSHIIDAMTELRTAIQEKYKVNIAPQDDWMRDVPDGGFVSEAAEILIGATNRKESRDTLASLKPGEYTIRVVGNKLVIIGYTDYLTSIAVESFITYIASADAAKLSVTNDYSVLKSQSDFFALMTGLTMYAIGDSYFAGSGIGKAATWVNQLGEKYAMHYVNYGIGGSTVSNYVTDKNPMCIRFKDMEKGNADIILLEGGRNDRTKEVPLGTNDSTDTKTFKGALNTMINDMMVTYPNALIILVTPWYTTGKVAATGYTNITYADAMRELVAYRNDPRLVCLYAADKDATGVNMNDANFRAQYCIAPDDVSHLNEAGMNMVLPYMEQFIATEYAKFKGLTLDS